MVEQRLARLQGWVTVGVAAALTVIVLVMSLLAWNSYNIGREREKLHAVTIDLCLNLDRLTVLYQQTVVLLNKQVSSLPPGPEREFQAQLRNIILAAATELQARSC